MKIGNVELDNEYFLAPMAGFTETAFRSICSFAGAGLTTTEMVSAKGLVYGSENTADLLISEDNETKKAVQLFSNEPEIIADAVCHCDIQKFDMIDINMGCPVPKIVKNGMGSALLLQPNIASKVVESAVLHSKKPVTVKMRIGIQGMEINAIDFAKLMQDSGASAITVHGRTREQMYMGSTNWEIIDNIAKTLQIPVIGNGDIISCDQAKNILKTTNCKGVAIGRGALGNPWIFSKLSGKPFDLKPMEVVKLHLDIMLKYYPKELVFPAMRKHFSYYVKNKRNSKVYRDKINRTNDYDEIISILNEAFNENC